MADSPTPTVPAVEGWFTTGPEPALLGQRCGACGTVVFPPTATWCPNPSCVGEDLAAVELSRRGRIWSFTDARYQPPPPYVAADPYVPFTLAAVELQPEGMIVLGQVVPGVTPADLTVGDEVELVLGTLYTEDGTDVQIWRWQPVAAPAGSATGSAAGGLSRAEGGRP